VHENSSFDIPTAETATVSIFCREVNKMFHEIRFLINQNGVICSGGNLYSFIYQEIKIIMFMDKK
jgi:hypothetical protein